MSFSGTREGTATPHEMHEWAFTSLEGGKRKGKNNREKEREGEEWVGPSVQRKEKKRFVVLSRWALLSVWCYGIKEG